MCLVIPFTFKASAHCDDTSTGEENLKFKKLSKASKVKVICIILLSTTSHI